MDLPNVDELQTMILSVFYRAKHQGVDRRTESMVEVDPATGLPEKASDLLPTSRAVFGEKLAYQIRVEPEYWARVFAGLSWKHKDQWSNEEAWAVSELEMRIKLAVRRMAEQGWLNERYPSEWDGSDMPLASDGFAKRAAITTSGMREAEKQCAGTKWGSGPTSILHGAPSDIINKAPQHAQDQWRKENRASGAS